LRAPNQYRLVYVRTFYDEVGPMEGKPVDREVTRMYTKWKPWAGQKIRTHDAYEIEFRFKENA
jgi:hypothetical protein